MLLVIDNASTQCTLALPIVCIKIVLIFEPIGLQFYANEGLWKLKS